MYPDEEFNRTPMMRDTGCAVTIGAMVVNFFSNAFSESGISKTDPGRLNENLKNMKDGFNNHEFRWKTLEAISDGKIKVLKQQSIEKFSMRQLQKFVDQDLKNNKPVAVQITRTIDGDRGEHWLLITGKENGKYRVYDPGSKSIFVYNPYIIMHRTRLDGKKVQVVYEGITKIQQFDIR